MSCQRRDNTGSCSHQQCPFSSETSHGYNCIDIMFEAIDNNNVSFCEVGEGCLKKCPHSWVKDDGSLQYKASKQFVNRIMNECYE